MKEIDSFGWNALLGTLTEKQKEQFEACMTAQREVNVLTEGKMKEI